MDTLVERIQTEVEDAFQDLLNPVLDQLDIRPDVDLSALDRLNILVNKAEEIAERAPFHVNNPWAELGTGVAVGGADTVNDELSGCAILAGLGGGDRLFLTVDDRFDDGQGGYGVGGKGNDFIRGTALADLIFGETGDDTVLGLAGDDLIFAEAGDDVINGGDGEDQILGAKRNDDLRGDGGNDELHGGSGRDTLFGGDGNDCLNRGDDSDLITAGDRKTCCQVAKEKIR